MGSIVFYPHSSINKPNPGNPKFSSKETSLHTSWGNNLLISLPSIRAVGIRSGVVATRSTDNDREKARLSKGTLYDSSTLEEISSLFKRIQTSIAKEKSTTSRKRSSNSSKEISSAKQAEEKPSSRKSDELKTFYPETAEMKPTRPPSNFVKRSPIAPLQISFTKQEDELKTGPSSSDIATEELKNIEDMTVPALKELAKSRGIRGYSWLKKSELIELLMA